jgi:two-component system, sensor histidine kinase PdtaS
LMERTRPLRRLPVAARYLLAVVIVGAFFGIRASLQALDGFPYLLFFPAIILCAVVLDRGTGFFATVLSAALALYFFVPPYGSFRIPTGGGFLALVLFVLTGFFLAAVVEALRVTAETLKETQNQLETSKAQTDLLLVDINHRVKNHLQSMAALLALSRKDVCDDRSREALDAAAGRIQVLARVYDRLHLHGRGTMVRTRDFLQDLGAALRESLVGMRPIVLRITAEDTDMDSNRAVIMGLVVNELVGNALKHAFPAERAGSVFVRFMRSEEQYRLEVEDDGVGRAVSPPRPGGGSRLLPALAQQLGGKLAYEQAEGTRACISFPLKEAR